MSIPAKLFPYKKRKLKINNKKWPRVVVPKHNIKLRNKILQLKSKLIVINSKVNQPSFKPQLMDKINTNIRLNLLNKKYKQLLKFNTASVVYLSHNAITALKLQLNKKKKVIKKLIRDKENFLHTLPKYKLSAQFKRANAYKKLINAKKKFSRVYTNHKMLGQYKRTGVYKKLQANKLNKNVIKIIYAK